MTRLLILVSSLGLLACADDPDPKNSATNNNNTNTNNTNNSTDPCGSFDATDCPTRCKVLTTSCNELTLSACFEPDVSPSPIPCGDLEPEQCQHQSTSDGCDRGTCSWIQTGGCGEPEQLIFDDSPVCIPAQDCTPGNEAEECPEEHTCLALSEDACPEGFGGCAACATISHRCVPNQYLPQE